MDPQVDYCSRSSVPSQNPSYFGGHDFLGFLVGKQPKPEVSRPAGQEPFNEALIGSLEKMRK